MLKRAFPLLLLLSAWIGLFGQQVAFAQNPALARPVTVAQQSAGMGGMDCSEMAMKSASKSESSVPCKKMTSDCVAQMSCATPVALNENHGSTAAVSRAPEIFHRMPVSFLAGRSDGPEPHPPSLI